MLGFKLIHVSKMGVSWEYDMSLSLADFRTNHHLPCSCHNFNPWPVISYCWYLDYFWQNFYRFFFTISCGRIAIFSCALDSMCKNLYLWIFKCDCFLCDCDIGFHLIQVYLQETICSINTSEAHYSDVTWQSCCLKSQPTWLPVQQLVQANKEGIKSII